MAEILDVSICSAFYLNWQIAKELSPTSFPPFYTQKLRASFLVEELSFGDAVENESSVAVDEFQNDIDDGKEDTMLQWLWPPTCIDLSEHQVLQMVLI